MIVMLLIWSAALLVWWINFRPYLEDFAPDDQISIKVARNSALMLSIYMGVAAIPAGIIIGVYLF